MGANNSKLGTATPADEADDVKGALARASKEIEQYPIERIPESRRAMLRLYGPQLVGLDIENGEGQWSGAQLAGSCRQLRRGATPPAREEERFGSVTPRRITTIGELVADRRAEGLGEDGALIATADALAEGRGLDPMLVLDEIPGISAGMRRGLAKAARSIPQRISDEIGQSLPASLTTDACDRSWRFGYYLRCAEAAA